MGELVYIIKQKLLWARDIPQGLRILAGLENDPDLVWNTHIMVYKCL